MGRIKNYGKTWRFTPRHHLEPTSKDELAEIVKSARGIRVMGARHSWSRGIVSEDTLISLDRMNQVVQVDKERMQVTMQAGIRIEDLIVELDKQGLAFVNMGSIAKQSIAGAIATGTHGTGRGYPCLADQVHSLALIDGCGEDRILDRNHPDFDAVAVGLGAFGIVYEVTLSVVPAFQMHAVTEAMPFDDVIENFDALASAHDHFKLWWFVPNDDAIVFRQDHTDAPRNDSDLRRWFKDEFLAVVTYRPILLLQKIWRDRLVLWTNRILGGEYAKRFDRICTSHIAFLTPWPPPHRETEWAFDYANAPELLREYRALMLASDHTYSFVQEIRVTKADSFWASPSYGRDSLWLSMYNIDRADRWDDQLRTFEAFARKHGGRPHWGKEASFEPEYLKAHYPKLEEFGALRSRYDPDGKFANAWIRGIFGN